MKELIGKLMQVLELAVENLEAGAVWNLLHPPTANRI